MSISRISVTENLTVVLAILGSLLVEVLCVGVHGLILFVARITFTQHLKDLLLGCCRSHHIYVQLLSCLFYWYALVARWRVVTAVYSILPELCMEKKPVCSLLSLPADSLYVEFAGCVHGFSVLFEPCCTRPVAGSSR